MLVHKCCLFIYFFKFHFSFCFSFIIFYFEKQITSELLFKLYLKSDKYDYPEMRSIWFLLEIKSCFNLSIYLLTFKIIQYFHGKFYFLYLHFQRINEERWNVQKVKLLFFYLSNSKTENKIWIDFSKYVCTYSLKFNWMLNGACTMKDVMM